MSCERSTDVRRMYLQSEIKLSVYTASLVKCFLAIQFSLPLSQEYFRTDCHVLIHSGIVNLLVALIPRLENVLIF